MSGRHAANSAPLRTLATIKKAGRRQDAHEGRMHANLRIERPEEESFLFTQIAPL